MRRKLVKVDIIDEGEERLLVQVFSDGTEDRIPIAKESSRRKRLSAKIAWYWDLKTGRRKFY